MAASATDRRCCVASVVPGTSSSTICSRLPVPRGPAIVSRMGTKSRETIYGGSVRAAAERATEARRRFPEPPQMTPPQTVDDCGQCVT